MREVFFHYNDGFWYFHVSFYSETDIMLYIYRTKLSDKFAGGFYCKIFDIYRI